MGLIIEGEKDPDEHNWDYFYITLRLLICFIVFLCFKQHCLI